LTALKLFSLKQIILIQSLLQRYYIWNQIEICKKDFSVLICFVLKKNVMIWGHLDLGVLRSYLSLQFEKMLIYDWSPNGLKWFLLLQWPPLLSDFKWGQFYITFWFEVIQGYLWCKMLKLKGLVPNQHWRTDFIWSSKKIIFVTTHKFWKLLSWQNFVPW
jgi:hypothetical protein